MTCIHCKRPVRWWDRYGYRITTDGTLRWHYDCEGTPRWVAWASVLLVVVCFVLVGSALEVMR